MAIGDVIARLSVVLGLDTAAFEKGATLAEKRMAQSQRKFEKLGKSMAGLGARMSVALTAPLVALGKASFDAAVESAEAVAQVETRLKSMGPVAGRTAEQLEKLAKQLQHTSTFDDDDILRNVTANLLTFGNVSGPVFDRAQQAIVDLSVGFGQDLKSSAVQVGKALQDPIKGLSALTRVGVTFTAAQKEQITAMVAAGDVVGAQTLLLQALESQFKGSAQASRDAAPGSDTIDAWRDFQETIGALIIKVLPPLTDFLTKVLEKFNNLSPGMQKVVVVGAALVAVLGPVLTVLGGLITVGAPVLAFLGTLSAAIGTVGAAIGLSLGPLALIAVAIGAVYLAWANWDKIEVIVRRTFQAVKTWMADKLAAVWKVVTDAIDRVKRAFSNLYDAVVGNSYIPDMVDGIASEMKRLDAVMVAPVKAATSAAEEAFRDMSGNVQAMLDRLFPEIRELLGYREDLATIGQSGLSPAMQAEARRRAGFALAGVSGKPGDADLADAGPIATVDMDAVQKGLERIAEATSRVSKGWGELKELGGEVFGELSHQLKGVILGFQSLGDAIKNVALRLADKLLDNAFASLGSAIGFPAFANGTNFAPGGLALVGERGPELVNLPRGSRVFDNRETSHMMGSSDRRVTMNITTRDADSFRRSERQVTRGMQRRLAV